jgi:oligopeptide/dipeptide ABC transporter ATP-binding protein
VRNLKTYFYTFDGVAKAVDDVAFYLNAGETLGLVGESGCGKSVTALSIMRLIKDPPGRIVNGNIFFEGADLVKLSESKMQSIRGARISMIFQEPMTSLNPVLTIGQQLTEMLTLHMKMNDDAARKRAIEIMTLVGIPGAANRIDDYPHHFSGGMRQRVMIAMGISCNPKMLIADEPTTALDVTTQAQLLEMMRDVVERFRASLVIVTHNLGVVARYAQRIYIMYAGRIVESGTTKDIFAEPRHPYTMGLLRCIPRLDEEEGHKLVPIDGLPPNLINMPPTCAFLPRCSHKIDQCYREPWPDLAPVDGNNHFIRCYADTKGVKVK